MLPRQSRIEPEHNAQRDSSIPLKTALLHFPSLTEQQVACRKPTNRKYLKFKGLIFKASMKTCQNVTAVYLRLPAAEGATMAWSMER